jgi:hypothetical protein
VGRLDPRRSGGRAPGGESLAELVARVQRSLATVPQGHAFGVCGPAVVGAAVVEVLEALGGT